jgi:hypothetical protein
MLTVYTSYVEHFGNQFLKFLRFLQASFEYKREKERERERERERWMESERERAFLAFELISFVFCDTFFVCFLFSSGLRVLRE